MPNGQSTEYVDEPIPPQDMPFTYPMPPVNEFMSEGSLKFQLSSEDIIDEIKHTLLGHKKEYDTKSEKEVWKSNPKNLGVINENGINVLEVFLRGRLNKIFKLTKLTEDVIFYMAVSCGTNLWDLMFLNYNNWDIKDPAHMKMIVDYITDTVYATLCAAKDGEYLMFLKTTQRIHEIQSFQQRPQTQGQMPRSRISKIPIIGKLFG